MQAIEMDAEIDEHHEIRLKIPEAVHARRARVIVMFEETGEASPDSPRVFGQYRGKVEMAADFDEPLSEGFWTGENG